MKGKLLKKKNLLLVGFTVIVGFIINMPLFTKNILTADVLLNTTYYSGYSWELSLGRFGLFIIGLLKSYLVIPHLELFISLILVGFIGLLLIKLFDIKNKYLKLLVCFILVISPNISTTLLFNYCSLPYTLAFFCSVFSIYILFENKSKLKYLGSCISLIVALFCYQAYIQVSLTLFVLMVIKKLLEKSFSIKDLVKYILTIVVGLISYFLLMKLSLLVFNIDMASYSGASNFGINSILNIPKEIINTYITFYDYYFNNKILNNTYLLNNILNLLILILFVVLVIYRSIKSKLKLNEYIILFISILILPIVMNFILLIMPNTKMQLLMSASYILLFIFAIYLVKDFKYSKSFLIILLLLLSRNFIIENYASMKSLEITYNKTYKIASNMLDNINSYGYKNKVMITGNLDNNEYYNYTNENNLEHLSELNYGFISNFSLFWDNYVNIKNGWERFFYEYLGYNLNFVSEEEYNKILEMDEFKEMATYPNKDSIKMIDNIIVIKIN